MAHKTVPFTRCLNHQLSEDQMSPAGLVCPQCKQRLYTDPPRGRCLSFWESQPGAYSAEGEPCFVYTLVWDDYRIRSLHAPDSQDDPRGRKIRLAAEAPSVAGEASFRRWRNRLNDGPSALRPPYSDTDFKGDLGFGDDQLEAE